MAAGTLLTLESFNIQTTRPVAGEGFGGVVQEPYAFTQAGGHPEALTVSATFASETLPGGEEIPTQEARDLVIDLPPGLTASVPEVHACPLEEALKGTLCPADTQVGVYTVRTPNGSALFGPIVDVTPEAGQAGELALEVAGVDVLLTVRAAWTPDGYGAAVVVHGLPETKALGVQMTLWGVPAEARHDSQRGLLCTMQRGGRSECEGGGQSAGIAPRPFLTMGADCVAGPQSAFAFADSWEEPGRWAHADATTPALTGCPMLAFSPALELAPESSLADEATGATIAVTSPPRPESSAEALGIAPLHTLRVTLPQGVSIDPAVAIGVHACPAIGPEGFGLSSASEQPLGPETVGAGEELGPDGFKRLAPGSCPPDSTLGSVEAFTPLLQHPLRGRVYLAQPLCGSAGEQPCTAADAGTGRMLRLYIEIGGVGEGEAAGGAPAGTGVVVKLLAVVEADPATGQLTLEIADAPQLPIEDLKVSLAGGASALLATPASCGPATTTSDLSPWSAPGLTPGGLLVAGAPDANPYSTYEVTGCELPERFTPGFIAGTLEARGASSSALTVTVTRGDREPYLRALQVRLPPGLSARLGDVARCPPAAVSAGGCPAASRIGSAIVEAGAGLRPLGLEGSIYLTGPYGGAPFGLAIVVGADAGPFDLGVLVVRARIEIDPLTAAVTITSDPLAQIVLGVPLRLRRISLDIDKPGFILNPTDCKAMSVTGAVEGLAAGPGSAVAAVAAAEGSGSASAVTAAVSSPFAASACGGLPFTPRLSARTQARSSRTRGASLFVSIAAPGHDQANLRKLQVQLPRKLPARFSAIQSSCPAEQFATNPAGCPAGSEIGIATVLTPLVRHGLTGPAYFVSHLGPKLPELVMVLQGEGIRLDIAARTLISNARATTLIAGAVPDIPFTRFTLALPRGPHAALAAPRGKLCHEHLVIPVKLTGQNGAVVKRKVRVRVSGCGHARGRKRRASDGHAHRRGPSRVAIGTSKSAHSRR